MHILLKKGQGEKSIGQAYSINTLGTIFGAILSLYWIMPHLGLKAVIETGGIINITFGFIMLLCFMRPLLDSSFAAITALTAIVLVNIIAVASLDQKWMASGVFRLRYHAKPLNPITSGPGGFNVLYHKDGRTASISVTQDPTAIQIRTNGKQMPLCPPQIHPFQMR